MKATLGTKVTTLQRQVATLRRQVRALRTAGVAGPQGPAGPAGANGAPGAPGVSGYQLANRPHTLLAAEDGNNWTDHGGQPVGTDSSVNVRLLCAAVAG